MAPAVKGTAGSGRERGLAAEPGAVRPTAVSTLRTALLLALIAFPSRALANDGSFDGAGANLVPLQETRVSMVSEDIVATYPVGKDFLYGMGDWRVDATYVFRNPTQDTVTLQMGFPEARCPGDGDCNIDKPFQNLVTRVRGEKVEHRRGTVSLARNFKVLGRFRFPTVVADFKHTDDPAPSPVRLVEVKGEFYSELEYEMRNWTPKRDLYVAFWPVLLEPASPPRTDLPAGPRCPLLVDSASWDAFNAMHDEEERRDSEVARLVDEWSKHPIERLRTCRLYIDAKFGRIFEDERWNRYFYGERLNAPRNPPFAFFHPNPGFRPSIYGLLDLAFLELLDRAMRKAEERSPTL